MKRLLLRLMAIAVLVPAICFPAAARPPEPYTAVLEEMTPRRKAALILGGTIAGVTGLWITLYKRGKK